MPYYACQIGQTVSYLVSVMVASDLREASGREVVPATEQQPGELRMERALQAAPLSREPQLPALPFLLPTLKRARQAGQTHVPTLHTPASKHAATKKPALPLAPERWWWCVTEGSGFSGSTSGHKAHHTKPSTAKR
jgi:hypothetical protein